LFTYTTLNGLIWLVMWVSGGTLEPREYDLKEYWTWKPAGKKTWIVRTFTKGHFWEHGRSKASSHEGLVLDENDSTFRMNSARMGSAISPEGKGDECISTPPRAVIPRE